MIKFLHAADLHLGLRITRFEKSACDRIEEARFEALEQIRNKAAEHQVHFVLIAGDVFDDHSVAKRTAERAFTESYTSTSSKQMCISFWSSKGTSRWRKATSIAF